MVAIRGHSVRRGSILPLVVLSLVGMCGFVALAVDVGMLAAAKNQCQNAADAAAMAGARTLNGTQTTSNQNAAVTNAQNAAMANHVLTEPITASDIPTSAIVLGTYHYDTNSQTFVPQFPPSPPDTYDLAQVTVTHTNGVAFSKIFNLAPFSVSATAIAAHRPRDTTIVLDYSGSMNNESDIWNCESYLGSFENTSNNTDPVIPQWGSYNTTFSPLCQL